MANRRLCMLGGRSVGKSTVTVQFVEQHFAAGYNPTIENTFHRQMKHKGREFNLEIIDTAGHDEHTLFNTAHTIGMHGYFLVFALNSRESFELIKTINDKLLTALGVESFPRVLVGNKSDLHVDKQVTEDEGRALAREWDCPYVEVSGKLNNNIDELFTLMLSETEKDSNPADAPPPPPKSICAIV